jgi:hypothetical protein
MVKIFSSFDTSLYTNLFLQKQKEFGVENVIGIRMWYAFWVFDIFPRLLFFVVTLAVIRSIDWRIKNIYEIIPQIIILILQISTTLFLIVEYGVPLLTLYLDYKMDFAIVCPSELINYNQSNLFARSSKTIKANTIKTISLDKSGFIKSIFNYGTLTFLSEWDEENKWELDIYYVYKPEQVKNEASRILSLRE